MRMPYHNLDQTTRERRRRGRELRLTRRRPEVMLLEARRRINIAITMAERVDSQSKIVQK
jgi:hypothetical protein